MKKAVSNAKKLCLDISRLSRVQIMHIRDCAVSLVRKAYPVMEDDAEVLSPNEDFVKEYREVSEKLISGCDKNEYDSDSAVSFTNISGGDFGNLCRALLCRYIWELLLGSTHEIRLEHFFHKESSLPDFQIAYVKNSYSDEAYKIFSSVMPGASVVYPGGFSAVCEEVYNNQAGFCILPYETSDDGALSGFRQLITKYELVQVMSCSVASDTSNEHKITRFALLSKGLCDFKLPKGSQSFLKIIADAPENTLLSSIYCAAELNGLKLVKCESVPLEWDTERYSFAITFALEDAEPLPFLLYLALEVPQSSPNSIWFDLLFL